MNNMNMTKEEAIRRIKAWNLDPDDIEVLSVVIPELKESEDEKIRKALIHLINEQDGFLTAINGISVKDIIAYLERQKEQKCSLSFDAISSWLRDHANNYVNGEFNKFHHCVDYDGTINVERLIADLKAAVDSGTFDVYEQKDQKSAENISQLTVQGKGVYKICPRCKERMVRDDSKVYTSILPQYGYKCPKCGEMEFDTVMYDSPETEEQKPTEVKPRFKIGDTLKKKNKDYTFVIDKIQGGFYLTSDKHFFPIEEQDSWELLEQKSADIDLDTLVIELEETIGTSPHSRETIKDFFQRAVQKYMNCLRIASSRIGELIEENYYLKEQKLDVHENDFVSNPAEWSEEDEDMRKKAIEYITLYSDEYGDYNEIKKVLAWLISLPERFNLQPKQEWSEDIIRKAIKEVGLTQHQINWFKTNVFPPKKEWSKEDEEHLDSIIESYKELLKDYSANNGVDYIPYNTPVVVRTVLNDIEFLRSLRPQPEVVWAIKDAKPGDILTTGTVTFIFKSVDKNGFVSMYCSYAVSTTGEYINISDTATVDSEGARPASIEQRREFLDKLLKYISSQPHWRPSEEQMRAVFDASERNDKLGSVLSTLYNDLKKL